MEINPAHPQSAFPNAATMDPPHEPTEQDPAHPRPAVPKAATTDPPHEPKEQNPAHPQSAVPNAAATTDPPHESPKPTSHLRRKKTRGLIHILRVALFMMRIRPSKSNTLPLNDGSRSMWRKLVGSMRPLYLQSNQSPPQSPEPLLAFPLNHSPSSESIREDALSSVSESPTGSSSQYASAVGLNELDQPEENPPEEAIEEEGQDNYYDGEGDEMIDAKAEEFIAQFYQLMRLQSLDDMDRRYKAMSLRSLG